MAGLIGTALADEPVKPATTNETSPAADPDTGAVNERNGDRADRDAAARELLRKMIRRAADSFFGPREPAGKPSIANDGDTRTRIERDLIDGRAPMDPEVLALLGRVRRRIAAHDWDTVTELIHSIPVQSRSLLVADEDSRLVPLADELFRLLGTMPAAHTENHEIRYGAAGRRLLNIATTTGDFRMLGEVATRYFCTTAGRDAVQRLVAYHIDRGESTLARLWLERRARFAVAGRVDPSTALDRLRTSLSAALDVPQSDQMDSATRSRAASHEADMAELLSALQRSQVAAPLIDDYPMLSGTPRRQSIQREADPVPLTRWSIPMTQSDRIRRGIDDLAMRLRTNHRALIPTGTAISVNERLAVPTLRGVAVLDARSGRQLWETACNPSPESLLLGLAGPSAVSNVPPNAAVARRMQVARLMSSSPEPDNDPLTALLFRDGVRGILSSDGVRLFVIEDRAVFPAGSRAAGFRRGARLNDPNHRSWSTNVLSAYDFESGRRLWRAGGPAQGDMIVRPLAEHYFFGPPLPVGDELYAVAETNGEIRLVVMDAGTGNPLWVQLLGLADSSIDRDLYRRNWCVQPALADGVLVCPTTLGWMVAIDRLQRSIIWAHRYTRPVSNLNGDSPERLVSRKVLNTRWPASAPVIAGDRVFHTPPEASLVECLDLMDGRRIWHRPKGRLLYLGGVCGNRVLMVGRGTLDAHSTRDGRLLWSCRYPENSGLPCGRGIATSTQYILPLDSGRLLSVELESGNAELSHSTAPAGSLGNLTFCHNQLLSLSARGLTAFALRSDVLEDGLDEPGSVESRVRLAELQHLDGDRNTALSTLNQLNPDQLSPSERKRVERVEFEVLVERIREDESPDESLLERAHRLAHSDHDRLLVAQASIDRWLADENAQAAFDALLNLLNAGFTGAPVQAESAGVRLEFDTWIANRLRRTWDSGTERDRGRFAKVIEQELRKATSDPAPRQVRLARLFEFQSAAVRLQQRLAEEFSATGQFLAAEQLLLRLAGNSDRDVSREAGERIERLLEENRLHADAKRYRLTRKSGTNTIARKRPSDTGDLADTAKPDADNTTRTHNDVVWKLERAGSAYSANRLLGDVDHGRFGTQMLRELRLNCDHVRRRLQFVRQADGVTDWSVALNSVRPATGRPDIALSGHMLLVLHAGVLHCLSPVERRIEWTRSLPTESIPATRTFRVHSVGQRALVPAASLAGWRRSVRPVLACVGPNAVCIRLDGNLLVLDSLTGEPLWQRTLSSTARVNGTDTAVLVGEEDGTVEVFRLSDGRRIDCPGIERLCSNAIAHRPAGLLVLDSSPGLFGLAATTGIRLHDPLARRNAWSRSWAGRVRMAFVDDETLAVLGEDGSLQLLNPDDGRTLPLDAAREGGRTHDGVSAILADANRVYTLGNSSAQTTIRRFGSLPALHVNGTIAAFDRSTGARLWEHTVNDLQLSLEHFDHLPLLVLFSSRVQEASSPVAFTMRITAIDKQTGKPVFDEQWTSARSADVRTLRFNSQTNQIELQSYYERIRLIASPAPGNDERS